MQQFLKRYIACDHRMNRKPYIMALVVFYIISFGFSGYIADQIFSDPSLHPLELAQQKAQGSITAEQYNSKIQEIQNSISPWISIIGGLIGLAFLPAVAMRLKDVNFSPYLSLLLPFVSIIAILTRLSGSPILPHSAMAILGVVIFVGEVLLIFLPGTKGANRYGADPLEK